ncbi:hypothetical protein C8J57DRAFT_1237498 [Mycena rebaudengoi]|nr:hypothetical protein C8J57DRAFT_1237498 [Mycena rebaudengoi]
MTMNTVEFEQGGLSVRWERRIGARTVVVILGELLELVTVTDRIVDAGPMSERSVFWGGAAGWVLRRDSGGGHTVGSSVLGSGGRDSGAVEMLFIVKADASKVKDCATTPASAATALCPQIGRQTPAPERTENSLMGTCRRFKLGPKINQPVYRRAHSHKQAGIERNYNPEAMCPEPEAQGAFGNEIRGHRLISSPPRFAKIANCGSFRQYKVDAESGDVRIISALASDIIGRTVFSQLNTLRCCPESSRGL